MHALIIEQDAWVSLMIEDVLLDSGYTTCAIATTAEEAILLAKKKCPDLITSEVRLGGSCGIETVRLICGDRNILVVFVTATGWEVRNRNSELAVVQKPFHPRDIRAALKKAVSSPPPSTW